jgi:hypothetical protein
VCLEDARSQVGAAGVVGGRAAHIRELGQAPQYRAGPGLAGPDSAGLRARRQQHGCRCAAGRQSQHGQHVAGAVPGQRASEASLLARLAEAADRNRKLAEENARLRGSSPTPSATGAPAPAGYPDPAPRRQHLDNNHARRTGAPAGSQTASATPSRSWWLILAQAARLSSRRARWLVRCRSSWVPVQ